MKTMATSSNSPDSFGQSGSGGRRIRLWAFALLLASPAFWQGCGEEQDESGSDSVAEYDPWDDYSIDAPQGVVQSTLNESPYLYPEQICEPVPEGVELPPGATYTVDESGQELVCVWRSVVGNVPEGFAFTELATCDEAFTQAPSWFVAPTQRYVSDLALLEDEAFTAELDWVQSQVESSGCACCHASDVNSGNTSGFDVSAPAVWTDTLETYQIAMISGRLDDHILFGALEADVNHGFSRESTMFPSTDPERMMAFFDAEFDRRSGTLEDEEEAQAAFDTFFNRLEEPFSDCVAPWQGLEDGRVIWNGDDEVRQFYVLKTDAKTPGFPPNRDRPEGTVWAIYVKPDQAPIPSGSIELGTVPEGAYQAVPADGSPPVFTPGETYRLFATPDFQLIRSISCTITYSEPS
jgi:hypothetical protein